MLIVKSVFLTLDDNNIARLRTYNFQTGNIHFFTLVYTLVKYQGNLHS